MTPQTSKSVHKWLYYYTYSIGESRQYQTLDANRDFLLRVRALKMLYHTSSTSRSSTLIMILFLLEATVPEIQAAKVFSTFLRFPSQGESGESQKDRCYEVFCILQEGPTRHQVFFYSYWRRNVELSDREKTVFCFQGESEESQEKVLYKKGTSSVQELSNDTSLVFLRCLVQMLERLLTKQPTNQATNQPTYNSLLVTLR